MAAQNPDQHPLLTQLLARWPFKIVAVALANKMARIALRSWAISSAFDPRHPRIPHYIQCRTVKPNILAVSALMTSSAIGPSKCPFGNRPPAKAIKY